MSKSFFEVFPSIKLNNETTQMFIEASVTKVVTNHTRDKIRVYLECNHIIKKQIISNVENEIRHQLFNNANVDIEIVERYKLSSLYTPTYLLEEYLDSMIYELGLSSVIERNILLNSKITFENENIMCIQLENSIVAKDRQGIIESYIQRVFTERFNVSIEVRVVFREPKSSHIDEYEVKIQNEIDSILKAQKESADRAEEEKESKKEEKKIEYKNEFVPRKSVSTSGMIYGRAFDDEPIKLEEVQNEMGEVTIKGQILKVDTREIRNKKTIIIFDITDFTDTITVKMFVKNEYLANVLSEVKKGAFVYIKGITMIDKYDSELTIGSVSGIKRATDFTVTRKDINVRKRVELHCHTKMSDMDAVNTAHDLVKRAHEWGHSAIAITDHGVVQAFPDAFHYIEDIRRKDKDDPFKVIYGVEAYIVDDLKDIALNEKGQSLDDTYVVFDIETTGFSAISDKIIEIGAVKVVGGEIVDNFSSFVNPRVPIPFKITQLTSITDQMVMSAESIEEVLPKFLNFVGDAALVAHNAGFDVGFIEQNMRYQEIEGQFTVLDTIALARILLPTLSRFKLNTVAKALNISLENHHRAVDDAKATAEIFVKFISMLKDSGIDTLSKLNTYGDSNIDIIKKNRTFHCIILAQNETGRVNLYRLITKSHMKYFNRQPRIPKSELSKLREGLIVGSACEAGELYQALLDEASDERVAKIVNFYDYLEIQPVGNNNFMIGSDRTPRIHSEEDIRNINRKIVELGEHFNKPVVATCDVHFLDPEDSKYRAIIMAGKGFSDADNQPPLYLHTTQEMLDEFEYLGSKKAEEVVIENTNKVADMIEDVRPIHPDKCPPVIENSEEDLRSICYDKAHSMYGDPLPKIVEDRLEKELNSIISNGYAVMYIIAQKLVWKSNEDGYLVGSRGSVGSSFVATMAGITEVNPLSPHYYCNKCHYSDFESEDVKAYAGACGYDMPDKVCPNCGEKLKKDGFDIPFETFLGFEGDKEPDIDLNFSGDYQAKAHRYTEEIFREGQTFKAGTVGTLAEKTAFGYVKNYYDEHNMHKRNCEIDRIVEGCKGVRRSTGQHPGGIIVLPHGREIEEFTPVQHPANDMNTDIVTTHFDYHSIDSNLLKLDILGHDDPTMIKALEKFINSDAMDNEYNEESNPFKATEIALDDKGVMSLFHDTSALGIKPKDISGTKLGCLGIPEFGTDFVIQMVVEAKPQTLSDLIRISGLSHGTDVWLNNAQVLIHEGKATISTAICTRDDIMTYLINMGMDPALSFKIMEAVRKGKGLSAEWEEAMKAANIPDWYIWSCKKIKYMFPKAHAAAYVMMAYRIAYCKINFPLAYYAAYFGIRADAFSYEIMCQGKEKLEYFIKEYMARDSDNSYKFSKKEEDTLKDMRLVQEMFARGYEFVPIDIYKAKAREFIIIGDKLMPPLSSIDGMGEKAAETVEEASKNGEYLSRDDFRNRTKVSKTVVDAMAELGLLGDIPESNQMSLFDL
ncbi:MAG: PolC-type DNA polymerase III [Suipraeoptans sp.]